MPQPAFSDPASALRGLSAEEARRRLASEGPNELPQDAPRSTAAIALEVVREPMFLMLIAAASLYVVMGELSDAAMLSVAVLGVIGITIVQERRTERALDALRDLSSPRALVIRDGAPVRIAGKEVVRGDLVVISEGDRVPCDAVLRTAVNVTVDEALLTGESVPVRKRASATAVALDRPGGDDLPSVYSGSLVTAGQGIAEAVATGVRSELGKIGKALAQVTPEATLLARETARLVRVFTVLGLTACGFVVVAYALSRGGSAASWKEGFLAGIAMAMSALPEELPVVLTVFLALGAWRISRQNVLTRRMPAVETLGAATVLCVDKTGTLTENRMVLRELVAEGVEVAADGELPEAHLQLLGAAALACKPTAFDPMERAVLARAAREPALSNAGWQLVREYALSPELLAVSHAWQTPDGALEVAAKGAPEAIAELCRLPAERSAELTAAASTLARRGLRVLGVARGALAAGALPDAQTELALSFVGLIAFADPLRATVPAAVAECRSAGVRVIMITGDYPVTAQTIARAAGLARPDAVITGAELAVMSDEALAARIGEIDVFARVVPEQKLRIVGALKASGQIVAMTGDGVNDAPALRSAHIGIAMGGRGTDVAREAASLVLLDDDFSSIVAAIRLGRRIFDNIKKAISFVMAVHVPIVGLSTLPVFFADWPLLLLPVHIVFLELVIDPSCSLVFEAEEPEDDVMRRPPRSPRERLFSRRTIAAAVAQGASVLVACAAVFVVAKRDHSVDAARALTFVTLVLAFFCIILVNRSWSRSALAMLRVRNQALGWVAAGAAATLAAALALPGVRSLFHFAPLHAWDLALAVVAGASSVLWFELVKARWRAPAA